MCVYVCMCVYVYVCVCVYVYVCMYVCMYVCVWGVEVIVVTYSRYKENRRDRKWRGGNGGREWEVWERYWECGEGGNVLGGVGEGEEVFSWGGGGERGTKRQNGIKMLREMNGSMAARGTGLGSQGDRVRQPGGQG